MDESFILKVTSKGTEHELPARLVRIGFIHQFHISIDGRTLIFEFDEERNYRVIDPSGNISQTTDTSLIEAILKELSSLHG